MKRINHITAITIALSFVTSAATAQSTLYERAHKQIKNDPNKRIFTVVYENDVIGKGTDQYYTNGARISYMDISAKFPNIAKTIASYVPTFDINDTSSAFYSVGQNMYTPQNITQRTQDPDDRPWAGYLYGSIGMITITDNHTDELEASIGIVGSHSLAEQTQKFVHRHVTDSPTPKGWSNQLNNEPALLLGWKRGFPSALSTEVGPLFTSVSPYYGVTLGNVYTFANTGFTLRISPNNERLQDTPIRVHPSLPGTGYFQTPEDKWSWYLFAGVDGRAIARNIFLDGNTFADSHNVDKKHFVADLNAGIALTYDKFRISYTLVSRTKEFNNQDQSSLFGAISLGYKF